MSNYRGRFAPSPTGKLHAGSLVAALASYLDARAHDGRWLIRIEDIDPPRDIVGAAQHILNTLGALGMQSDEEVIWQSRRSDAYREALESLVSQGFVYGCACSRKEIAERSQALGLPSGVYPGTCRCGTAGRPVRALRFLSDSKPVSFIDRLAGRITQNVERDVGDFVLKRADGLWAYQLAVVVDDAYSGVTDIVRGEDLLDNTPRQLQLQSALGVSRPRYMHLPLVRHSDGQKLSKQNGATPLNPEALEAELERAWQHLGFRPIGARNIQCFLKEATTLWQERFVKERCHG